MGLDEIFLNRQQITIFLPLTGSTLMVNPFSSTFLSVRNLIHRTVPLEVTVGGLVEPQRLLTTLPSLNSNPPSLQEGKVKDYEVWRISCWCGQLINNSLSYNKCNDIHVKISACSLTVSTPSNLKQCKKLKLKLNWLTGMSRKRNKKMAAAVAVFGESENILIHVKFDRFRKEQVYKPRY